MFLFAAGAIGLDQITMLDDAFFADKSYLDPSPQEWIYLDL
jgi:hypothetical protein